MPKVTKDSVTIFINELETTHLMSVSHLITLDVVDFDNSFKEKNQKYYLKVVNT